MHAEKRRAHQSHAPRAALRLARPERGRADEFPLFPSQGGQPCQIHAAEPVPHRCVARMCQHGRGSRVDSL